MKLNNWFIIGDRAHGNVEGNKNFHNGEFIRTSEIVERTDKSITTKSGSTYELGNTYIQSDKSGVEIE